MTHNKQSDAGIVPVKVANKGLSSPAESLEGRAATKRNPQDQSIRRTQRRVSMQQAAARIRQAVKREPKDKLTALLHHVTPLTLREAFFQLKKTSAAGVDGVTWEQYKVGLDDRLIDLHRRIHRGSYRARPSRRVEIPKADGGTRPLGIAALEDKIVQKAVVEIILMPIYESEFLGFSYGFRPGRGAHDALDALAVGIEEHKVSWVVDADVRAFFDRIDRNWLIEFLALRIGDKRVIRLIIKWLNAGVMEGHQWQDDLRGTPQGAVVSPVLANIYLHYVLDLWFHRQWRPKQANGEAIIVRYADDFVVGFQHKRDAESFLRDLKVRLDKFALELHPDKTRLIEFGRFATANRRKRGLRRPETFDFLGFTHYCRTRRDGKFGLGRKPVAKRVTRTLKRIKEELYRRINHDVYEVAAWLGRVVNGWFNYYAVPTSIRYLNKFMRRLKRMWLKVLRRRSQKDCFPWEKLERVSTLFWPLIKIRHPWPSVRFAVKHSR